MVGSKLFCKGVSVAQDNGKQDLLGLLFLHEHCEVLPTKFLVMVPWVPLPVICPGERNVRAGVFPGAVSFSSPAWSSPQRKVCVSGEAGISSFPPLRL